MAQPSGQVGLAPGYTSEYFYYPTTSGAGGMWDAHNGAFLTKTGTAGLATEGGATVALGNGSTYYNLPSALSIPAGWSIVFKARATSLNNNTMICGDNTTTTNFVWLHSSSTSKIRINGADYAAANTTQITSAIYIVVYDPATTSLKWFKDGVQIGSTLSTSGNALAPLVVKTLLSGYSANSFALNGAVEFINLIPFVLDATEISSRTANPYQALDNSSSTTFSTSVTTVLPSFSGSSFVSPITSFTITTVSPLFSGVASTGQALFSFDTTILSPIFSGNSVGDISSGTIAITDLRDLTTGILRTNEAGITAIVSNISTGNLVVLLSNQTSTVGGNLVLSHASILAGTQYRVTIILQDGSEGTWKYTAV